MIPKHVRFIFSVAAVVAVAIVWSAMAREARSQVPVKRVYAAALLFEQQGRYEKAAEMYRSVLERVPEHAGAADRLAVLQQHLGVQIGQGAKPFRSDLKQQKNQPAQKIELIDASQDVDAVIQQPPLVTQEDSFLVRLRHGLQESKRKLAEKARGPESKPDSGAAASAEALANGVGDAATTDAVPDRRPFMTRLGEAVQKTKTKLAGKMRGEPVGEPTASVQAGAPFGRTGPIQPAGQAYARLKNQEQQVLRLADVVRKGNDDQVLQAAYVLGRVGPQAIGAAAALREELGRRGGIAQLQVAEAVIRVEGQNAQATGILIRQLASGETTQRMLAAAAMERVHGQERKRCIKALIEGLDDPIADIRAIAALTLGSYGADSQMAVPALLKHVDDPSADVCRAVTTALQCIENKAQMSAVPARRVILGGS